MKILFIGMRDYANLCNGIARAVNDLVGERAARVVTVHPHPYGYEEDWVVAAGRLDTGLDAHAREADWIISTGDGNYGLFEEALRDLPLKKGVKVGVTHAGTSYRTNPSFYHERDNALGARVRFVGADSYRLAASDGHAALATVPYFGACALVTPGDPGPLPLVTHTPSSRAKKGTDIILPELARAEAAGWCHTSLSEGGVPHAEVMARRARAQIHVDQINPEVGGWGQSAIEAMATRCAVLADLRHVVTDVYRYFPKPPIEDVRDAWELRGWLELLCRRRDLLEEKRARSRAWAAANSAPEAVARYFLGHLDRA